MDKLSREDVKRLLEIAENSGLRYNMDDNPVVAGGAPHSTYLFCRHVGVS